jgi:hypothetical protein
MNETVHDLSHFKPTVMNETVHDLSHFKSTVMNETVDARLATGLQIFQGLRPEVHFLVRLG